jgi:hypothetical protein
MWSWWPPYRWQQARGEASRTAEGPAGRIVRPANTGQEPAKIRSLTRVESAPTLADEAIQPKNIAA